MLKLMLFSAVACCANATANALWKYQLSIRPLDVGSLLGLLGSVIAWRIMAGVICYMGSMLIFLYLLSHYRLADVAPMLAMTYVFNLAAAYFWFGESITFGQAAGLALILSGIIFYGRCAGGGVQ